MKILRKTSLGLLFLFFITTDTLAQSNGSDESQGIQALIDVLNADIKELDFLSEQIGKAEKREYDILLYRRDERSFRVLADFDNLLSNLSELTDETPQKEGLTAQLTALAMGVGDAIFNRVNEINQRIIQSSAKLESLSGGALIVAQAHIDNMESIRIRYYQALVSHMASLNTLGMPTQSLNDRLDPVLYLYAETLAGRIELNSAAHNEVQLRANQEPGNNDIKATLMQLNARHEVDVNRLETIIMVLDSLGLDSSDYKAVMLQQTGSLSVSFFSIQALSTVLKDGWSSIKEALKANSPDILFRLLVFIAILFVFRILSRITRRVVKAASDRSSLNMSALLKRILISSSGGIVMVTGILMALSQIGISLAPMLAGLGVAGFIVGFALQDSLGNFAAGAMILIYRPFDVDDIVEVTGAFGTVKKMNLVSTTITTLDNQTLVVPNSKIWGDVIKNVTAQNIRRVDLEFGIGYDDDIDHAERILTEIVTAHGKVLKDPKPNVRLHTLGDSSVNFIVRPWTKTHDYWDVYWDIMREVKLRFDREGISIPFPQRDVHLYSEVNT
ncbi:mechanosensitive ion channel family protein [Pseudomonadota bacterium]